MHNFTQETHALYYTESLMYYITMETHKPHYTRIHSQHHTGNTHKKYTHYIRQKTRSTLQLKNLLNITQETHALHYTRKTRSKLDKKHQCT